MTKKARQQRQRAREWERNGMNTIGIWTLCLIGLGLIAYMAYMGF